MLNAHFPSRIESFWLSTTCPFFINNPPPPPTQKIRYPAKMNLISLRHVNMCVCNHPICRLLAKTALTGCISHECRRKPFWETMGTCSGDVQNPTFANSSLFWRYAPRVCTMRPVYMHCVYTSCCPLRGEGATLFCPVGPDWIGSL